MTSHADNTSLLNENSAREDDAGVMDPIYIQTQVCCITLLGDTLYVLYENKDEKINTYNATTYELQESQLIVPGLRGIMDMTACRQNRCLYISDRVNECVHRVDLSSGGTVTKWPVNDIPWALSVTVESTLLVTCPWSQQIKEFSTDGELERTITVQANILRPWHAILISTSSYLKSDGMQYIVCHGSHALDDPDHRVCVVDAGGRNVKSFGGPRGSETPNHFLVPTHLAVDDSTNSVYVVDVHNRRVVQLSNDADKLDYKREVLSRADFKWRPRRIHLDAERRRLYVVDTDEYVIGRILVVKLQ